MNALVISNNQYQQMTGQYVLTDANSSEVIAIIKADYLEDVAPKVIKALKEHHDEEHSDVYNVNVINCHNTKFDADGIWDEDDEEAEPNQRNYNLIRTAYYE